VPPAVLSCNITDCPAQTIGPPVIAGGGGCTVTNVVTEQPPAVYMIVVIPDERPYTTPLEDPTVATPVLLLLHEPPVVTSLNAVVDSIHTLRVPPIAEGGRFTVTVDVVKQPVGGK